MTHDAHGLQRGLADNRFTQPRDSGLISPCAVIKLADFKIADRKYSEARIFFLNRFCISKFGQISKENEINNKSNERNICYRNFSYHFCRSNISFSNI